MELKACEVKVAAMIVAVGFVGVGCEEQAARPTPQRPDRVEVRLRMDGGPAVPEPAEEDIDWSDAAYDELAPSRTDGKPTFSNQWFLNNVAVWDRVLAPLKGTPNLNYLEVGVFEGQSFLWMFDQVLTHPGSKGTAIDVFFFEGLEERFRENLDRAGISDRVTVIKGFSNDALRPLEPNSFDVIYIDGSHMAANVIRDGILSWDLLKVGGILIFDDYGLNPRFPPAIRPGPMIDALVTAFGKEADVLSRGWQLIMRKRATDCVENCSALGPYFYRWSDRANEVGGGTLFDPRTNARVPITPEEGTIIEELLVSQPIGYTFFWPKREMWARPETQALMQRLNLLQPVAVAQ